MTFILCFLSLAIAETPLTEVVAPINKVVAPFGLEWGTKKSLLKLNYLECTKTKEVFEICSVENVPKNVSMAESYSLIFHNNKGLQKILMTSTDITEDITGSKGKAMYNKIKNSITKKYAEPKSYEYTGNELYDEYDEFYQCLKYDGCGSFISIWSLPKGGSISVQLKGLSRGTGYLSIAYESMDWEQILDDLEKRKESADEDAF
jgi:hypothetical protein